MKNAQSEPSSAASAASSSRLRPSPKRSFSSIRAAAASAEPPPRPAPTGAPFLRLICTGGMSKRLFSRLRAFTVRSWAGSQLQGQILTIEPSGSSALRILPCASGAAANCRPLSRTVSVPADPAPFPVMPASAFPVSASPASASPSASGSMSSSSPNWSQGTKRVSRL